MQNNAIENSSKMNIDVDTNIIELNDRFNAIKEQGWIKGNINNHGSAGILFEQLLENPSNNFEIPDYNGIELKTKTSTKEKYISLFSSVPDSFLFEIKRIVEMYGYPDKQYKQFNIFNMDVYSYRYNKASSGYYFKLQVDEKEKVVTLNVYNNKFELIDNYSKWSFGLLKTKLERKLTYLALIKSEKKFINNEVYFRYSSIDFYKLKNFETFVNLIKKGAIKLIFRIGIYKNEKKFGQLYDHGSAFCIKISKLEELFQKIMIDDN